jgi:cytochrome d ubiquinol oxidase subunit II
MTTILGFSLAELLSFILLAAIIIYALSGGADFGSGIWNLLAFGERKLEQRKVAVKLIGPIWEANHVWMIIVLVMLFTIFTPAFTVIMRELFTPIMLILFGIVLRGAGYAFTLYGSSKDKLYITWDKIFGAASFFTPYLFGFTLGCVASADPHLENYFAHACGIFSLVLFAFLSAIYIAADIDPKYIKLKQDFRRRALICTGILLPIAVSVYLLAQGHAPYLFSKLSTIWAPYLLTTTSIMAILTIVLLVKDKYEAARYTAVIQVATIIVGWALAQYPYIMLPNFTVYNSHVPEPTMKVVLTALAIGSVILLPSLFYLYYLFDRRDLGLESESDLPEN